MSDRSRTTITPVESAGGLDNKLRKFLQNPYKIMQPYIKKDMTVLDMGCGPGFFTIEIAKLLADTGEVIAADLQQGMLDIVKQKIQGTRFKERIRLHLCREHNLGLTTKVDFILAFYFLHEVPDQKNLLEEFKSILKPRGTIFIIEPKIHVPKKDFEKTVGIAVDLGMTVREKPRIFFSRAVILTNN